MGLARASASAPPYLRGQWVRSYLHGLFEQRRDSAACACTSPRLLPQSRGPHPREQGIHKHPEAARRLSADAPGSAGEARGIFPTYLMTFLGADFRNSTPESLSVDMRGFVSCYSGVRRTAGFGTSAAHDEAHGRRNRRTLRRLQQRRTQGPQGSPLGMEGPSGRSLLPNFYSKSLVSHWAFRVNWYLEQIGALGT